MSYDGPFVPNLVLHFGKTYPVPSMISGNLNMRSNSWAQRPRRPPLNSTKQKMGIAEALYDNIGETTDELTFHRGDILNVLEDNPSTGRLDPGWWLCANRAGDIGIAPANRLRFIRYTQDSNMIVTPRRNGDIFSYTSDQEEVNQAAQNQYWKRQLLRPRSFSDARDGPRFRNADSPLLVNRRDVYDIPEENVSGAGATSGDHATPDKFGSLQFRKPRVHHIPIRIEAPTPTRKFRNNRASASSDTEVIRSNRSTRQSFNREPASPLNIITSSGLPKKFPPYKDGNVASITRSKQSSLLFPDSNPTRCSTQAVTGDRRSATSGGSFENVYQAPRAASFPATEKLAGSNFDDTRSSSRFSSPSTVSSASTSPIHSTRLSYGSQRDSGSVRSSPTGSWGLYAQSPSPDRQGTSVGSGTQGLVYEEATHNEMRNGSDFGTAEVTMRQPEREHISSTLKDTTEDSNTITSFVTQKDNPRGSQPSLVGSDQSNKNQSFVEDQPGLYQVPCNIRVGSQNHDSDASRESGERLSATNNRTDSSLSTHSGRSSQLSYGSVELAKGGKAEPLKTDATGSSNESKESGGSSPLACPNTYDVLPPHSDNKCVPDFDYIDNQEGGVASTVAEPLVDSAVKYRFSQAESVASSENHNATKDSHPSTGGEHPARLSMGSSASEDSDYQALLSAKDIRLSTHSALEQLQAYEQDLQNSVTILSARVDQSVDDKEEVAMVIKNNCTMVKRCLDSFVDFASGAFINAYRFSSDIGPSRRLAHLIRPLRKSQYVLQESLTEFHKKNWKITRSTSPAHTDDHELNCFLAITRAVPQDAEQVAAFIRSNALTLFGEMTGSNGQQVSDLGVRQEADHASTDTSNNSRSKRSSNLARTDSTIRRVQSRPLPTPPAVRIEGPYDPPYTASDQNSSNISLPGDTEESSTHLLAHRPYLNSDRPIVISNGEDEQVFADYDFVDSASPDHVGTERFVLTNGYHTSGELNPREECQHPSALSDAAGVVPSDHHNQTAAFGLALPSGHNEPTVQIDSEIYHFATGSRLSSEDKQIFQFYASEVDHHIETLCSAIDNFLGVVEKNEIPEVFVNSSKFVILAAHKLVYIADSISLCLKDASMARQISEYSDRLCNSLKLSVTATKQAALQYPSPPSSQAMVDGVVKISHAAHELKDFIRENAKL